MLDPCSRCFPKRNRPTLTCGGGGVEIKERRLELVRGMVRASGRRRGAAFDRLVDVIYALSSTSLHNEFASRGWARKAYQSWLTDELTRLLEGR